MSSGEAESDHPRRPARRRRLMSLIAAITPSRVSLSEVSASATRPISTPVYLLSIFSCFFIYRRVDLYVRPVISNMYHCLFSFLIFSLLTTSSIKLNLNLNRSSSSISDHVCVALFVVR